MKKLFLTLIMVVLFSGIAVAYTFDGDVDPAQFFSYSLVGQPEQTGPQSFIMSLKSDNKNPLFAINAVMILNGKIYIVAYAYYDKDVFRHFKLIQGHYIEEMPTPETIKMLEKKLDKLRGVTGV